MRFDLHTHSTVSDGTESPAVVVAEAARAGLSGLALTDHDTFGGWEEARAAAQQHGLGFIPGMEVTSQTGWASVHMLSYLHDPRDPGMAQINEDVRRRRWRRAQKICQRMAEDFPITWDLVREQVSDGASIGRPHIADALVAVGVVENRSEAFRKYLHKNSPYYVNQHSPHPTEVIQRIRAAGGVPIIAHAMAGARGNTVSLDELEEMVEAGMLGVEVYHRDNSDEGRQLLLDLAARRNLIVTGSSDYHGAAGKPNLLGENTTDEEQLLRILDAGTGTSASGPLPH